MAKIIKRIIEELKSDFSSEKNILSLTLVGSFSNQNKPLEKFNDLDLVVICNELTAPFLSNLKKIMGRLEKDYSSDKIGITHSFKIGPIKVPSKKKQTIMFHFLIYTKEGYKKYESTLTRFSFRHHKPILGAPLSKINPVSSVLVKDLFNKIDGIPAMKSWIIKKEIFYLEPTINGMNVIKNNLEGKLYPEVIIYSVLRLASNMLRTRKIYAETDLKMCKLFEKKFSITSNKLPFEFYLYKKRLRKNGFFDKSDINKIKEKSLNFIKECENVLK